MNNVWPVLERELRVASRRPTTWRLRWATGIAGALATGGCFWFYGGMGGAAMEAGTTLFTLLGVLCGAWAMIAGCQRTADAIGRERRDGTLGLLFLTDLRGWDVVLGKLAAAGCEIAYQMLALLPMMAIPLLAGGVGLASLGLLVVALLNGLVMSLSFGLLGSLWSREPRQAVGLAVSFTLAATCFPWGVFAFACSREGAGPMTDYLLTLLPSPVVPFLVAVPQLQFIPRSVTLVALVLQSCMSLLILAFTARQVRTVWQQGGRRGWKAWWRDLVDRWRYGSPEVRARRRSWLLGQGAWVWLSRRERWKHGLPWLLVVAQLGLQAWIGFAVGIESSLGDSSVVFAVVFHFLMRLWVAAESAHTLGEQRSNGAMELLLTTPLAPADILAQQGRAVRDLLLWPWVALALNDVACGVWIVASDNAMNFRTHLWIHGALVLTAPFHAMAMRWGATWRVLLGRPTNVAVGRALTSALVIPCAVTGVGVFQVVALASGSWSQPRQGVLGSMVAWVALQVTWACLLELRDERRVRAGFREQVTSGKGVTSASQAAH